MDGARSARDTEVMASAVVGRADELGRVSDLVRGARDGRFGAVVVEGDAGMGKTSLVAAACEAVGEDVLVLPGGCLPLTSVSVPLIGLRTAVRALPREERPAFLSGAAAAASMSLPVAFDEWLGEQLDARPVVLVVDDLQWADPATLDALMYVLAGPVERALAVLLTRRTGEMGPAGGVDNWLGAATRLPGVGRMRLGPLSHDAVADLAAWAGRTAGHSA